MSRVIRAKTCIKLLWFRCLEILSIVLQHVIDDQMFASAKSPQILSAINLKWSSNNHYAKMGNFGISYPQKMWLF